MADPTGATETWETEDAVATLALISPRVLTLAPPEPAVGVITVGWTHSEGREKSDGMGGIENPDGRTQSDGIAGMEKSEGIIQPDAMAGMEKSEGMLQPPDAGPPTASTANLPLMGGVITAMTDVVPVAFSLA